ncbi:MAG: D-amino-acid transaminase [Pseudomonadota bacterium]
MGRLAYVNGRYLPHGQAQVHIEDRGYQFADGVYEVVPIAEGTLVDEELHLDRLEYSLGELQIAMPMRREALKLISREVIRRNHLTNGILYMQVTRGVAPRDHKFPTKPTKPALVMTAKQTKPATPEALAKGLSVVTCPDIRWKRPDIKSISLLPNCLAKQQAAEEGAGEAWMLDDQGCVTEGSSTNAWIVTKDKRVITRPSDEREILNGITRRVLIDLMAKQGYICEERPFSLEEAFEASEAFITSSSNFVMPVTKIDDRVVGNGNPGPLSQALREAYIAAFSGSGQLQ